MHPPLWQVFAFTGLWIHLLLPNKHSPLHTMYSLLCCWGVWYNKEYINLVGIIYSKSNTVISSWIKAQQVSGRCKHACHGLSLLLVALPTTSNYMGWQATYAHILIRFRFICLATGYKYGGKTLKSTAQCSLNCSNSVTSTGTGRSSDSQAMRLYFHSIYRCKVTAHLPPHGSPHYPWA